MSIRDALKHIGHKDEQHEENRAAMAEDIKEIKTELDQEANKSAAKRAFNKPVDEEFEPETEFDTSEEDFEEDSFDHDADEDFEDHEEFQELEENLKTPPELEDHQDLANEIAQNESASSQVQETPTENGSEPENGLKPDTGMPEIPDSHMGADIEQEESQESFEDNKEEKSISERLTYLEEEFLDKETDHQSRINQLEKRVENMEISDGTEQNDLQQIQDRIDRLEQRVDESDTYETLEDRLTELEDELLNPENHLERVLDSGMRKRLQSIESSIENLKQQKSSQEKVHELEEEMKSVNSLESRVKKLENETTLQPFEELQEKMSNLEERMRDVEKNSEGEKVEELWEALDEEIATLERKIEDNSSETDELLEQLADLSQLVKESLR